jgi:hypothetical protein
MIKELIAGYLQKFTYRMPKGLPQKHFRSTSRPTGEAPWSIAL